MSKYANNDHYLDPDTGIFKNRLDIENESDLNKAEASFSAWRSFELSNNPIQGGFDLEHLKAIHKHLFGDVYEWAGKIRDIDIAKGNSYFANHAHIISSARPLFDKLAKESYLNGLDADEFGKKSAYYLGEINALHPFREGNGRAQREFINHLAYKNGYFIKWYKINPKDMIEASIESFHKADNTKFASIIQKNIERYKNVEVDHPRLSVEERGQGLKGPEQRLSDYVRTLPEKDPRRIFTKEELRNNPEAKKARILQEKDDQNRGYALDSISRDLKAGKNLNMKDVRRLSREDLDGIKRHGDQHLKTIVQQHEQEKERDRGLER